jgi:hypothetical protein
MGVKFNFTNPISMSIASSAGFTTWAAMGYPTDPKQLVAVATSVLAGTAQTTQSSANPNVSSDSHISTSYVNNINTVE